MSLDSRVPPTKPVKLAHVRDVAINERRGLIEQSHERAEDQRAVTGISWGVRALDRVLVALDGKCGGSVLRGREVATAEHRELIDRCGRLSTDELTVAGLRLGLAALDRIQGALDGKGDGSMERRPIGDPTPARPLW